MRTSGHKVVHVFKVFRLFSEGGGVERYIHCLATRQSERGLQVGVASAASDGECNATSPERREYAVTVGGYGKLWSAVGQADLVHIHGPRIVYSAVAGLFSIIRGKQLVYTVHCFYGGRPGIGRAARWLWDNTVERILFAASRPVILLSEFWLKVAAGKRLSVRHCAVIPNGIEYTRLASVQVRGEKLKGDPSILVVSRLDAVKRIEDVIRALAKPGMEAAQAYIAGVGQERGNLLQLTQSMGIADRVALLGFQSDESVDKMVRGADVFVLSSAEEGMPTTFLEMLAKGLPVVTSDNPGSAAIAEVIGWPFVYPVGDVDAMVRLILNARGAEIANDVCAKLQRHFEWATVAERVLDAYERHA